jgi:hypothetical protein
MQTVVNRQDSSSYAWQLANMRVRYKSVYLIFGLLEMKIFLLSGWEYHRCSVGVAGVDYLGNSPVLF